MTTSLPFIRASTRRHRGPPWHPMTLNRPRGVSLSPLLLLAPLPPPSAVAESSQNAFFLSLNNVLNTSSERVGESRSETSRACNLYALFFCFLLLLLLLLFLSCVCLDAFTSFIKTVFRSSLIVVVVVSFPSSSSSISPLFSFQ